MPLVLATRNRHKVDELRAMLRIPGLPILSALDFPGLPSVVEDGETLEANALKKAISLARATGHWAIADDSGLEVRALNGAPGVHSAYFAGFPPNDEANNHKLLNCLAGVADRSARFRTVLALAEPRGWTDIVEGVCEGKIAMEPRGSNGFGYDPLFIPDGYRQTFAELPPEEKNRISHRGRAMAAALEKWRSLLLRLAEQST